MYDYLENNSILHKNQYGFHANKSTAKAVLHFLFNLYKNIGSGKVIFSLFLDFRDALDCELFIMAYHKDPFFIIIIICHDFLPTPRRGSHVK